ncbi:MAG: type II toxin-antitoxin system VapC family toxin [bacterium]
MPHYTIDAHPLIWHFTNSTKLSPKAKECIEEIEQGKSAGIIPSIVMAESFYVASKKRINFDYNDLLDKIILSPNYLLYPLDADILFKLGQMHPITELHDQIIVATALITESKLITKDKDIENSKVVDVIW